MGNKRPAYSAQDWGTWRLWMVGDIGEQRGQHAHGKSHNDYADSQLCPLTQSPAPL